MVSNKVYNLLLEETEEEKIEHDKFFFRGLASEMIEELNLLKSGTYEYPLTFEGMDNFYKPNLEPIFQTILDAQFDVKVKII
jgi:hypothetical protein